VSDHSGKQSWLHRRWSWVRYHRWVTTILVLAVVVCLGAAVHYAIESLQQRVTLLTGPEGSFNKDIGETLHDGFLQEPAWRLWGRSFYLTALETNGSQDNRSRVNNDRQGRLLGIALDGFSDTPHVRTMLHLTDLPLLILARPKFLGDIAKATTAPSSSAPTPQTFTTKFQLPDSSEAIAEVAVNLQLKTPAEPTFSQIAAYAKNVGKGRFYLGASGSGTRTLAREVLKSHKVSIDDVDRLSQLSFTEAAAALENGHLDVAFFLLPTGTDFVVDLLRHGDASLVGLDETSGFVSRNRFLSLTTIADGTICENIPAQSLATVHARLVLICSEFMPTDDASWLTRSIAGYLRRDEEIAPGLARDFVPGSDGTAYEMHDGARMFHEQRDPWYVIGSLTSIQWLFAGLGLFLTASVTAFASAFLPDFLRKLGWWPSPSHDSQSEATTDADGEQPQSPKTDSLTPAELLERANQLSDDFDKLPDPATPSQLVEIYNRFKDLERAIPAVKTNSQADKKLVESVRGALEKMDQELNHLGVVKAPASPATATP
jgi:TRAP-type uncharacterized transport system substrate-binding protein